MIARESPSKRERHRRSPQFHLRTLLLLSTLAAVCMALMQTAVIFGIVFTIASAAALARTARLTASGRTDSRPMGMARLIGMFLNSLAVVASMAAAWLCTLLVGCFAAGLFMLVVIASICKFLAAQCSRVSERARWLERHVLRGIEECTTLNGSLYRRFWAQCD